MIDASHRSHDQRRLLTSYTLLVHLLLQDFHTSLTEIQSFLLRDIIYAVLRILASCNNDNYSNSTEDKLKLTLLCDLLNDVCNTAIAICPEVRSSCILRLLLSTNFALRYTYLSHFPVKKSNFTSIKSNK